MDVAAYQSSSFVAWYGWDDAAGKYELLSESSKLRFPTLEPTVIDGLSDVKLGLKALIGLWEAIASWDRPDSKPIPYYEQDAVRIAMGYLSRLSYPDLVDLPQSRANLPTQGAIGSGTLLFRTFTSTVYISARASNGQLARKVPTTSSTHDSPWSSELTFCPALYLYSGLDGDPEMLGIAWISSAMEHSRIRNMTISASTDIDEKEIRIDQRCWGLVAITRDLDEPENTGEMKVEMEQILDELGTMPENSHALPSEPELRKKFIKSRMIEKVKIAFISGPIEGDGRNRHGCPMSFPYVGRGFLRVLLLSPRVSEDLGTGKTFHSYERLGIGEIELNSIDDIGELKFEDIVLA